MKLFKMKEEEPLTYFGRKLCPLLLLLFVVTLWKDCDATEDFACHAGGGFLFMGDRRERGAIIPRGDIIVEVGKGTREVLCRFNSTYIDNKDVYFATRTEVLPSEVVNSTTIRTKIHHFEPTKYELFCKLKRKKKGDKTLCSQIVKAGFPPLNVENISCISMDNIKVNCSWEKPFNPVLTRYHSNYSVPTFMKKGPCPLTDNPRFSSWCFWDKSNRIMLRDKFELYITGKNEFGTRNYTYRIDIPSIVVPDKISAEVSLIGPVRAKLTWNLTYPMDVFHFGLYHSVEYRVKGVDKWENVTFFFHKNNYLTLDPNRTFAVEINLPHSFTEYEFRVRIHTGVGEIKENMWSKYDILTLKTEPLPPKVAPKTSKSSFEVIEGLEKRVIFVNFKAIDKMLEGGKDFRYSSTVYSSTDSRELDVDPEIVTHAYIKYDNMDFTEYRFRIFPTNAEGLGTVYSEVIVPHSDCMPKKTEMFTVITSNSKSGKMFSLYWVPSRMPSAYCQGLGREIDSYTVFWCKRTFGNRCKERLDWMDIKKEDLSIKDLSSLTSANIIIYEKNITHLSEEHLYSFGVAANSGNYSSGIRWSSCIVDDTEPPLPPVTEVESLSNDSGSVLVKWNLKCMSISAVPIGFNISYCRSFVEDFGHCLSEVHYVEMNSPTSSEVLISDLNAGGSYIFSVSVLSIIGEGSQSYPKIIKLREDIPAGPPENMKILVMSNNSVTLSWDPPPKPQRRGIITKYKISVFPPLSENIVVPAASEEGNVLYQLKNLKSFTKYKIFVSSCNSKGCSISNPAELSFSTLPGVPDEVENFILDVSNWRLMWDLNHCNSRICSFDVQLPVNESDYRIVTINDKEILSLHEEGISCNYTEMKFAVRARGQDSNGHFLYSNWTTVLKEESECPSGILSLWIILLVVFICVFLTTIALLIMKFGWRKIMEMVKECKRSINVPRGIKASRTQNESPEDFSTFSQKSSFSAVEGSDPPLLIPSTPPRTEEKGGGSIKTRADSVSSEEVQLIDSSSDHERHGRNLSGSSDRSSGNDSALMSGCPSLNHNDQLDNLPGELTTFSLQETTLRQRSPGPPYVQHGIIPEKLSEGYVAAWSVPSLPHLYKEGLDNMQQSTPDLKESMCIVGWQNARRASTGYISMPDSDNDKDSPLKIIRDSMGEVSLARMPQRPSTGFVGLPHYSRHSFSPDVKMDSAKGGYVILAEGRSPSPPTNGYVSAGDPFSSFLKRPPSLPLIPKSFSAGENDLPLGAYVKVGSRENSANKGYVSAGRIGNVMNPQDSSNLEKIPTYVSCADPTTLSTSGDRNNVSAKSNSSNKNSKDLPNYSTLFSPYVELKDSGRWAHPVHAPHPPHLNSSAEGGRAGRVGPLPRPNTTEATMGHPTLDRNPSLSKQSSGYVSQETISNPEGVLISPKRLMMPSTPHNVALANSHQASMV